MTSAHDFSALTFFCLNCAAHVTSRLAAEPCRPSIEPESVGDAGRAVVGWVPGDAQ